MNPDNRRGNNNRTTKKIDTMRIAGIIVATSLLLSGLSVIGNYNSVLAQQSMTEEGTRPTGVGGTTDNATTTTMGGTAQGGNATTTTGAAGGNQSEVRLHLEEVRTALQNNDIQGALMHLDLALNVLGAGTQGNMTSTTSTR
jgi:hypothetical protein